MQYSIEWTMKKFHNLEVCVAFKEITNYQKIEFEGPPV